MDRSRSVHEKLAKSVDKTLLKHASKSQRALEEIEARAAARAAAERGGSAIPITRSTRKQLDQVANIRSVLSLSETPQFYDQLTSGNQATFITGMPLPRTLNPPKVAASGGKKKKKSASTADMIAEEAQAEVERLEVRPRAEDIREESPLSATFSDVAGFAKVASEIQVDNPNTQRRIAEPPDRGGGASSLSGAGLLSGQVDEGDNGGLATNRQTGATPGKNGNKTRQTLQPGTSAGTSAAQEEPSKQRSDEYNPLRDPDPGNAGNTPPRRRRTDMDDSNSDLDIPEHLYSILDPKFCTETMIRPITLLCFSPVQYNRSARGLPVRSRLVNTRFRC
jgi:hypothetical protein